MKRILQISNYFYPHRGGIEQVAREIANALPEQDYSQMILCFNEDAREGNIVCKRNETVREEVDGFPVIRCGCFAKIRSQSISFSYPHELKHILDEFVPDIVVFHYPNPFVARYLLRYLPDSCKLVIYWHLDIVKQKVLRKLFEGQNQKMIERADDIVAGSLPYLEGSPWLRSVREKVRVIPYCINAERLKLSLESEARAKVIRKENENKIICLAVGRHTAYKGIQYLIKASRLLDDRFQIYLIGEGDETTELKKLAAGDPKVHFLGIVDDLELKAYYLTADILCFPSVTKNEAFGIALAEGMYYGKPAVTFTIPGSGVNYVSIHGETGIEVPNRDVPAYAAAIRKLADDPELREKMGWAARKRVEDLFMMEHFQQNIRKLIETLK